MFLANLLIALREGLEAVLVVSIIVAYLVKSDRRDALPKLWLGVGLAALIPLVAGAIMTWGPKTLTFQAQEILGGTLSFVAVGMVTWMIFWMGKNARELKGELEGSLSKTLAEGGSGWGVVWIAVVAVGREGVETALFVWATVRSSIETSIMQTTAGVVTGLVLAVVLGVLIYQGAVRINLRIFFAVTGYFLIVVAAGIVAYGVGDLQEASVLPGFTNHAWDLSRYLPDGVARDVATRTVDLPGVTTYATTIETDYILADNNDEISSILAVFESMTLEEMDSHRFIGVPLRVTDDALRDRLDHDLTQRWEGVLDCHRNQDFLDFVPAGATKGSGLRALLDGPLSGREVEVWTIGDSWNDLDMHAVADHAVALPWSPPEVTAVCETTVGSMAELITTILEGDRHE